MTALKTVPLVVLVVALTACGSLGGNRGARKPPKQTRPITVVLVYNNGSSTCEAKFGKKPHHAFVDDTVAWEFINTCPADKNVTLDVKNGSSNPFTTSNPWTTSVPQNNASNPAEIDLVVSATAHGSYGFDIKVDGKTYDPKLDIDPYQ